MKKSFLHKIFAVILCFCLLPLYGLPVKADEPYKVSFLELTGSFFLPQHRNEADTDNLFIDYTAAAYCTIATDMMNGEQGVWVEYNSAEEQNRLAGSDYAERNKVSKYEAHKYYTYVTFIRIKNAGQAWFDSSDIRATFYRKEAICTVLSPELVRIAYNNPVTEWYTQDGYLLEKISVAFIEGVTAPKAGATAIYPKDTIDEDDTDYVILDNYWYEYNSYTDQKARKNGTRYAQSGSKKLTFKPGKYYSFASTLGSWYTSSVQFAFEPGVTKCYVNGKPASYVSYDNIGYSPEEGASRCTIYYDYTKLTAIKLGSATLSYTSTVYDGKVKKPTVKVKDSSGKVVSSSNYSVTYASGRKNVGKYSVTIKGKGGYTGTITKTFTIIPKGTSIRSLSASTKAFTAKWNIQTSKMAVNRITGYQIQYATNSRFTGAGSKTYSGYKVSSKKISGLKKRTTYYVRIRTYMTVKGTKYYSKWSAVKKVKTK